MQKYLIVITGPTGIGKTECSFKIQEQFTSSIISADSRQIYKELEIGTAKPNQLEIENHNIKLVDHISIFEDYDVGKFETEALVEIKQDYNNFNSTILCGGSGMYIKAVCEGLNDFPDVPKEIVDTLNDEFASHGIEWLQDKLKQEDPEYFGEVDIHNHRRLIRALSVINFTGRAYKDFIAKALPKRDFEVINIILDLERQEAYKRIDNRVLKMVERGLIDEAQSVFEFRHLRSLNTVGYSELFQHFLGNMTLDEAIEKVQINSRRYAKRQLTWLRNSSEGQRFHPMDIESITKYIRSRMQMG